MDREQALDVALGQIERQFGKGSVMRMSDQAAVAVGAVSTGSLALDLALGIGGLPRGRIVEVFGPEASGKTTLVYHAIAGTSAAGRRPRKASVTWMFARTTRRTPPRSGSVRAPNATSPSRTSSGRRRAQKSLSDASLPTLPIEFTRVRVDPVSEAAARGGGRRRSPGGGSCRGRRAG